jgi:flagellar basal body P-ring protein FlgI
MKELNPPPKKNKKIIKIVINKQAGAELCQVQVKLRIAVLNYDELNCNIKS